MLTLVADRFVSNGAGWLDLATDLPVRLHVSAGGSLDAQLSWDARCSTLASLRHPLLNPLIDFGALGPDRTFEAFLAAEPMRVSGAAASRVLTHAVRFLRAHDIPLTRPLADIVVRPVSAGLSTRGRPLGFVIQPRQVLAAIVDLLDSGGPPGTTEARIVGVPGSGLRTLATLVARAARQRGYVPICSQALLRRPVAEAVRERHVCLLHDAGDQALAAVVAGFLARIGAASARRHVVLRVLRSSGGSENALQVDSLGVDAMKGMVFVDPDYGPSPAELAEAAAHADGRPGAFLSRLGGVVFALPAPAPLVVHETPAPYGNLEAPARTGPPTVRRGVRAVLRASERAARLAARGRHVGATRLLSRAVRVLCARGDHVRAALAADQLGWLWLDRAQLPAAFRAFEQARDVCTTPTVAVLSGIGIGTARIEAGQMVDAEATLRAAVIASAATQSGVLEARARAALARCLFWQGRFEEAAECLTAPRDDAAAEERAALDTMSARVSLETGNTKAAGMRARRALDAVLGTGAPRVLLAARRALAAVFAASGDVEHAREQLRAVLTGARDAHLPLEAVRARIALLELAPGSAESRRASARLTSSARRLPPLLRFQVKAAVARASEAPLDRETREFMQRSAANALARATALPANPLADLESLVNLAHAAPDDATALERLCAELQARLRAATVLVASTGERQVLTTAGRPWHGELLAAQRALASGLTVPPGRDEQPAQAAEPIRYSGDIVGAVACRWTAGATVDSTRACAVLHLGALAMAPSVRALLDRTPAGRPGASSSRDEILGDSAAARRLRDAAARAARAPFPVLVEGESGSGKELVARAIHRLGPRRDRRFCAFNCAALSDDLLETELFGHTRGAFTGAVGERPGLFEEADGGTLFLDEVAELSPRAQAKLLRVLQDGEVRRVGENMPRHVDVRVVAATNRSLAREAAEGRFRADLRFRLDVVRLDVPPLRERADDVPILAARFWAGAADSVASHATLSPDAIAALARYDWPGNVRELQNAIAWIAVHSPRRGRIGVSGLPAHIAGAAPAGAASFEAAREEFERRFVKAALANASGHKSRAAEALGVTRQGLAKMMRRLGLEGTPDFER